MLDFMTGFNGHPRHPRQLHNEAGSSDPLTVLSKKGKWKWPPTWAAFSLPACPT